MNKIKYTIHGFQQLKLMQMKLSNDDALILKTIKDMYSSTKFEHIIHNNDKYIWMNHTSLIEYIPIIGSKRNLMRRIKHFCDIGLLSKVLRYEKKGTKGSFSYLKPNKSLDDLTEYNNDGVTNCHRGYDKLSQGVCQIVTGGMTNCHNKDSYNIDSSNIDSSNTTTTEKSKNVVVAETIDLNILKKNIEKEINATITIKSIKQLLQKTSEENINYYIDNWDKFKHIRKRNIAGYFISAVLNKYEIPKSEETFIKPIQATNYDQRKYKDEDWENVFENSHLL